MSKSNQLHEHESTLGPAVIDRHRATVSLMEELEAIDWYDQRARATTDEELQAILLHNRNEEMEHAAMLLEWLRRSHPEFDEQLRSYLFRDGSILTRESEADEGATLAIGGRKDGGTR